MRERPRKTAILLLLALLLAPAAPVRAADTGQFLFVNAAPQPVQAGATLRIQVVAINQGTETWDPNRAYLEAEIFGPDGKYLAKTDRLRLTGPVGPGTPLTAELSYAVPADWRNGHTLKVYVVNNDIRVVQSAPIAFSVLARPTAPPRRRPFTAGGTVVATYRTHTNQTKDAGDIALNLSGRAGERPYDFRLNTFHERDDLMDVHSILFNYHGEKVRVGVGDVQPSFSPLALSGGGIRGGMASTNKLDLGPVAVELSAVGGRTAEAKEGTSTSDGVFRRMLYGAEAGINLPGSVLLKANHVLVEDVKGSIDVRGPSLIPVENQTSGLTAAWVGKDGLSAEGAFQFSSHKTSSPAVTDTAWRIGLGLNRARWNASGAVARTGKDFIALGAPGIAADRLTYDLGLGVRPYDWLSVNGTFNQYKDDLEGDPNKVGTLQRTFNGAATATLPSKTGLNAGYSLTTVEGSPNTTQNNKTAGFSLGVTQPYEDGSLSAAYQRSEFTDKTSASHNLLTDTFNGTWNLILSKAVNTNLSMTFSDTDDLEDGSVLLTRTYSAAVNAVLTPDKLFAQGLVSATYSEDDDLVSPSDRRDTSMNLELTYKASAALSVSFGAFRTESSDALTPANSSGDSGGLFRVAYNF